MNSYEIIDTTADIGIRVEGSDLTDLCRNLLRGFYCIVFDKKDDVFNQNVYNAKEKKLIFENPEDLVFSLLNEAVFLLYTRNSLIYPVTVFENEVKYLILKNTEYIETEVKAATKHRLNVKKTGGNFEAVVILDI
ncbi:MAG: archease [Flexistipes sinusarabici]|uniref:Archease n=1 Tax=Flexistipes sinusarabici TaxID=2352 RepID=A0A5D0MP26_FLESI|nr:archease [Flexistipes sinusarabici]TYB32379.1 MAG: archease [Flexistipes sinusarabici]